MIVSPGTKRRYTENEFQLQELINHDHPTAVELPDLVRKCFDCLATTTQPIGSTRVKLFSIIHLWAEQCANLPSADIADKVHQTCIDILFSITHSKTITINFKDVKLELTDVQFEILNLACPQLLKNSPDLTKATIDKLLLFLENKKLLCDELLQLDEELKDYASSLVKQKIRKTIVQLLPTSGWESLLKTYFYFSRDTVMQQYCLKILGINLGNTKNNFPFICKEDSCFLINSENLATNEVSLKDCPILYYLIIGFASWRLCKCGITHEAIEHLSRLSPDSIGFRYLLLRHHLSHNNFEDALKEITIIVNDDVENLELHQQRLAIAIEAHKFAEALKETMYLLERKPENPSLLTSKAYAVYRLGDTAEAIAILNHLVKNDFLEAVYTRALLYREENRLQLALNDVLFCIQKNPSDLRALLLISQIYFDTGRYDQVINYTTQALEYNIHADDFLVYRGNAYLRRDLNEQARDDFTRLINEHPHVAEFYYLRGLSWIPSNPQAAREDFRNAVRLKPHDELFLNALEDDFDKQQKISPAA